jgi:ribosomal protein S12 methylthiotransferase accessory factor
VPSVRLSTSLRERGADEILAIARSLAPGLGISRVTEITRLDNVGIPVFVSIRPDAERGSVCVSAGKGLRPIEAEIGATMEAIELAWAEYRRCRATVAVQHAKVGDLGSAAQPFGILDHCPIWGTAIDLDARIATVMAEDLATGERVVVPAEAVLHPFPAELGGARYFGTHSNGLASGSSVAEATAHGLAEVLERDVLSFHLSVARSRRVALATLPAPIQALAARIAERGFALVVHAMSNPFGLAAFTSIIFDRNQPELVSPGDGLHPIREIALVRSVVETAQARLGFIHGGRDDLAGVYARYSHLTADQKAASFARQLAAFEDERDVIDYADVPDHPCPDLPAVMAVMTEAVHAIGARILRVVYTPPDSPVAVVRVIVPGLEIYSRDTSRIGPRLLAAIRR